MIPLFNYPLALIALGTLPALVAIYVLRNRYRRRTVSSLVLWRFSVQSKSGGATINRVQLPLLFFLELLALALLASAAAGPEWKMPELSRPLIVILDDSYSMRASSGGISARDRAESYLENTLRSYTSPARFILAGQRAYLLQTSPGGSANTQEILHQWKCWSASAAIDSAITLAAQLSQNQANILMLTDHKPPSDEVLSNRIQWRAFGEPMDNFAFTNASRTAFGDQDRCLLEIANFSDRSREVQLLVQLGDKTVQSSLLSIGMRSNERVIFNIPATAPVLRASINADSTDQDALGLDNEVELLPPVRRHVRVQVALADQDLQSLANRALDATGLRASISANPELLIRDSDGVVGKDCWTLRWEGAGAKDAFVGPFVIDTSHPLCQGVALPGVIWAGAKGTSAPGEVPVILAGNTPLLSVRDDALGRRFLRLNFNPNLSTLQNTPDWPILFWNLLQWRTGEMPGLKENNLRLGAEVMLKTTGNTVSVTDPDGATRNISVTGDQLALDAPMPGIYSVKMGAMTEQFFVNALSADESNLAGCASGQWGTWGETPQRRLEETSAAWIFGLVALGLLVAHLFLVNHGKGGGT